MKHQKSEAHKNGNEKWKVKVQISHGKDTSILEKLVPDPEKTVQNNRKYFKLLFQYVIWFAMNEIVILNKELQAEEIDWTDVQYELTQTRNSMHNIKDEVIQEGFRIREGFLHTNLAEGNIKSTYLCDFFTMTGANCSIYGCMTS